MNNNDTCYTSRNANTARCAAVCSVPFFCTNWQRWPASDELIKALYHQMNNALVTATITPSGYHMNPWTAESPNHPIITSLTMSITLSGDGKQYLCNTKLNYSMILLISYLSVVDTV